MTSQKSVKASLGVLLGALLLTSSSLASAETILLMMDSGPANKELIQRVADRLERAGLDVQIASASLDDSVLLLGCEVEEDDCLDGVAKAGGADSLLVLPSDGGMLIGRRNQERRSAQAPESADDEAGWLSAMQTALEIDLAAAASSTDAAASDVETESTPPSDGAEGTATGVAVNSTSEADSTAIVQSNSQPGDAPMSRVKTRSWVVLGSGAAVGTLGLLFVGIASSKQDKVDAHPIETAADFDALADLEASGENFTLAGNIALVGGTMAMLAGVGLAVWDIRHSQEQQGLTIAPSLGSQSVGLTLSWRSP